jgi:hypothetical protein
MYVSFDDGDHWQSLQLNLPVTSVRDIDVHGNDVVIATHGRGFWVLDDISALRQLSSEVAQGDAFLFKPTDALLTPPPSEDGTPQPKDEPLAENPPYGAYLDYYLKGAATGPLTIDIVDGQGQSIRHWSSDERPEPINPDTLNVPASWIKVQEPPSTAPGMHRWVWDLRLPPPPNARPGTGGAAVFRRNVPMATPGTYTVKMTVGGRSYSQPLEVKPDPRASGTARLQ